MCSKAGLIAYAEKALNPRIFIINYPTCTSRCNLAGKNAPIIILLLLLLFFIFIIIFFFWGGGHYGDYLLYLLIIGGAVLKYSSLSFSDDGKKLVSLSGIPDFMLTVWYVPPILQFSVKSSMKI